MRRAREIVTTAPVRRATRRRRAAVAAVAGLVLLPGCGSLAATDLPPAATPDASPRLAATPAGTVRAPTSSEDELDLGALPVPPSVRADDGRTTLTLDTRDRRLRARGAVTGTVGAGVGPVDLATNGGEVAYVSDVAADGIAVVRLRPTLAVTRRVSLPDSGPYALAYDRERFRLWATATQTNQLIELAGGARPVELARYPSVRRPVAVRVLDSGDVEVTGADGTVQRVTPRG